MTMGPQIRVSKQKPGNSAGGFFGMVMLNDPLKRLLVTCNVWG